MTIAEMTDAELGALLRAAHEAPTPTPPPDSESGEAGAHTVHDMTDADLVTLLQAARKATADPIIDELLRAAADRITMLATFLAEAESEVAA